jgi:hypothetical protein
MPKRSSGVRANGAKANGDAAEVLGGSAPPKPHLETAKLLEELQVPFDPVLIRWRANEFKFVQRRKFGLFFPHADPRAYKDRLNALFGPMAWCDSYAITTIPTKILVVCQLTINPFGPHAHSATGEEWSRNSNATTAAEAQAFKRACASFGLGRYLYYFPGAWLEVDRENQPLTVPSLPQWATPEGWKQGLRPEPVVVRPVAPVIEPTNENAVTRRSNCQNVVVQVLQMQEKLGTGLYRGLLRSVAQVWCPTDIRDIALQKKVLGHMEGALRGLERLSAATAKLGEEEVTRLLSSFELGSAADIKDMDTLYRVVVALEEAANRKS